ncbi:hypothetical protein [Caminibacter mediatlanticus]|uniref:Uncharacterized protein n=1 Tax=Caminibacter mediatlanticus TB-2 TaxID=391592 RepID=A0AAI9AH11_9BACT|nr:hypothetical protein [Caminibacter mediatlanticus]EDM23354.1 hypothetical protein CMTB2_08820 [Caminibacter mediatlanticus TB-2]
MKKIILLLTLFFANFVFAAEKLMPNGMAPEVHKINTTWGVILFFMWPILIIISYKFIEFTLKKSGLEKDL